MSGDEVLVFVVSLLGALLTWGDYFYNVGQLHSFYKAQKEKATLVFTPILCGAGLFILIKGFAAADVVNDTFYLFFYLLLGALWVRVWMPWLRLMGIFWRDDALERKNHSALFVVIAFIFGATACYGGANIGDGPGWWCVVFAGGIATLVWLLLWQILIVICGLCEKITVERDLNAGIRTAGYGLGSSIICGRGAAGDWTSAIQTVKEFSCAWPVIALFILAVLIEKLSTPSKSNQEYQHQPPSPYSAIMLAGFYIVISIVIVYLSPSLPENLDYQARP